MYAPPIALKPPDAGEEEIAFWNEHEVYVAIVAVMLPPVLPAKMTRVRREDELPLSWYR